MKRGYWMVARSRLMMLVAGVLFSLILLAVLASCVAVPDDGPAAAGTLEAVHQDIRSLDMRVAAVETRLPALTATAVPTLTVTPTPGIESILYDSGGIALSYTGTMTSTLALFDVTEVITPQMSIDMDLWRTDPAVAQKLATATLQLALIEAESAAGFYELYVPKSMPLAQPAAWHYYSSGMLTDTKTLFLQPGLPISQVVLIDVSANDDLADSVDALALAGANLNKARPAQILLRDESGATPKTILMPIDPEPPSGGDRIRAWCSTSCRFRWCNWFCRLLKK